MARAVTAVVGVVLLAAGAVTVAAATGLLPLLEPDALVAEVADLAARSRPATLAVLGLVAVVLVLLGTRLAARAVLGPRPTVDRALRLASAGPGRTEVTRAAVEDLVGRRLDALDGVSGSRVRVTAWDAGPVLRARVDLDTTVDVADLGRELPTLCTDLARLLGVTAVRLVPVLRVDRVATRVR